MTEAWYLVEEIYCRVSTDIRRTSLREVVGDWITDPWPCPLSSHSAAPAWDAMTTCRLVTNTNYPEFAGVERA